MHDGYIALGGAVLSDPRAELVNNNRCLAYIEGWNAKVRSGVLEERATPCIDWIEDCNPCPEAEFVFNDGDEFTLPELDPAPWYDANVRDSDRFLGVMGLEVQGAEDSTREATVVQAVGGGGVVGPVRHAPREMLVRALAVAVDSCGMEVGLNWMRSQVDFSADPCQGDVLWFIDCCPDCGSGPGSTPVGPCWANDYAELAINNGNTGASPGECPANTWWPVTYQDLIDGPPPPADPDDIQPNEWCAWVTNYRELSRGLPEFSCDIQECFTPYLRNFNNCRVIDGPTVVSRQVMHRVGEIAELEFTIVAADPAEYSPGAQALATQYAPTEVVRDLALPRHGLGNEFLPDRGIGRRAPGVPEPRIVVPEWDRQTIDLPRPTRWDFPSLPHLVWQFALRTIEKSGPVRIGLWEGDQLIGGFLVPFIPAGARIDLDAKRRRAVGRHLGVEADLPGIVKGYDGGGFSWPAEVDPHGSYRLTIDQPRDEGTRMLVAAGAAFKGVA